MGVSIIPIQEPFTYSWLESGLKLAGDSKLKKLRAHIGTYEEAGDWKRAGNRRYNFGKIRQMRSFWEYLTKNHCRKPHKKGKIWDGNSHLS